MPTYYVATDGNDTTGDGSSGTPWATLSKATTTAVDGDTIYVREGVYYAGAKALVSAKALTITRDPADTGEVRFSGASDPATDPAWSGSGPTWTQTRSAATMGIADSYDGTTDMTVVTYTLTSTGAITHLTQVAGTPSSGEWQRSGDSVIIADDPALGTVEVGYTEQCLEYDGDCGGSSLSNVTVSHYATRGSTGVHAAVRHNSSGGVTPIVGFTCTNVVFRDCANSGLLCRYDDAEVIGCTFRNIGRLGMSMDEVDGATIRTTVFDNCNAWSYGISASGGVKCFQAYRGVVYDSEFTDCPGSAIWIDGSCHDWKLYRNLMRNCEEGAFLETSSYIVVANCVLDKNRFGFRIDGVNQLELWNNVVISRPGEQSQAIYGLDGSRSTSYAETWANVQKGSTVSGEDPNPYLEVDAGNTYPTAEINDAGDQWAGFGAPTLVPWNLHGETWPMTYTTWDTENVTMCNNLFVGGEEDATYKGMLRFTRTDSTGATDAPPVVTKTWSSNQALEAEDMFDRMDYNAYVVDSGGGQLGNPDLFRWGNQGSVSSHATITALRTHLSNPVNDFEDNGLSATATNLDSWLVDYDEADVAYAHDYNPTGTAANAGTALPADIRALIGAPVDASPDIGIVVAVGIPAQPGGRVLLETGDSILLETGDTMLLEGDYITPAGTATLTGSGTLTATGRTVRRGAASLTATGTLAVTGKAIRSGVATLSGSATLTATGRAVRRATVSLTGSGTLAAAGSSSGTQTGAAALTASGTLTATGRTVRRGAVSLTATGSLTAVGTGTGTTGTGAASLSAAGTLTAAGRKVARGAASLTASGSLSASGLRVGTGRASLAGSSALSATGRKVARGSSSLSASSSLAVTGRRTRRATVALTGTGTLAATPGTVTRRATVALTGSGTLAGFGRLRAAPRAFTADLEAMVPLLELSPAVDADDLADIGTGDRVTELEPAGT